MILEKEDWEEPECCFRPHIAAAEAVHTGSADGGPSVREVIQGFDRLLDRDAKREAAIYLLSLIHICGGILLRGGPDPGPVCASRVADVYKRPAPMSIWTAIRPMIIPGPR